MAQIEMIDYQNGTLLVAPYENGELGLFVSNEPDEEAPSAEGGVWQSLRLDIAFRRGGGDWDEVSEDTYRRLGEHIQRGYEGKHKMKKEHKDDLHQAILEIMSSALLSFVEGGLN